MATSTFDIVDIKNEIQSILNTNNTTTSSLQDLSANMSKRVQRVLTVNPEKIDVLGSDYPFVTIYTEQKVLNQADIARTQVNAKRKADVDLQLVGAVWNQNFTDHTNDPADDDLEYLMENLEAVLRNYPELNGKVTWQVPQSVEYFSTVVDEDAHLRAARMKLRLTVFY